MVSHAFTVCARARVCMCEGEGGKEGMRGMEGKWGGGKREYLSIIF